MAAIQKRTQKNGKTTFHVRIRKRGFPTQCGTFSNISKAKEFAQRVEASMKEGRYFKTVEAKKHTLAELIDRYMDTVLPKKPKSVDKQTLQLEWWKKHLGYCLLSDLTPSLIAEYRDRLGKEVTVRGSQRSPATVVRYMAALSHVLTVGCKEWEWLQESPMSKVTKPQEPRGRVRFLDDEERMRLLEACKASSNPYLYLIVILALSTGMRFGEMIHLHWKNIDLENKRIILEETKNGERRAVPLVGHALDLMTTYFKNRRRDTDLLFPGKDPKKVTDIRFPWEKALQDAMITDFKFHDLRHTFASYLAMRKATLTELRSLLGHKSASMTARYSHLSEAHGMAVVSDMTQDIFKTT
ncbi:MAG: site-specific integrase [Chlamydiae bacterium]|nr:site-specific integrase [Chlamydiota bacterium]